MKGIFIIITILLGVLKIVSPDQWQDAVTEVAFSRIFFSLVSYSKCSLSVRLYTESEKKG